MYFNSTFNSKKVWLILVVKIALPFKTNTSNLLGIIIINVRDQLEIADMQALLNRFFIR